MICALVRTYRGRAWDGSAQGERPGSRPGFTGLQPAGDYQRGCRAV